MKKIKISDSEQSVSVFNKSAGIILILFVFCVMSFGREFTLLKIGSLYITEIILGIMLLVVMLNMRVIKDIPRELFFPLLIYFIMGVLYLCTSIMIGNPGYRDIVFFGYIFFLPAAFIVFSQKQQMMRFLFVVLFSNIVGLIIIRTCIYQNCSWPLLHEFWGRVKSFNYCIYYGIALSFLIPLFFYFQRTKLKILVAILSSLNVYLVIIWGVRAAWVSYIGLFLFAAFSLGRARIKEFLIYFVPCFVVVSGISLRFDYKPLYQEIYKGKLFSTGTFLTKSIVWAKKFAADINSQKIFKEKTSKLKSIEPEIAFRGELKTEEAPITAKVPSEKIPVAESPTEEAPITAKVPSEKIPVAESSTEEAPITQKRSGEVVSDISLRQSRPGPSISPDSVYFEVYEEAKNNDPDSEYMYDFSSISWRLDLWAKMINFGKASPFFGRGFGKYPVICKTGPIPAHNHLISIFYKMGAVGLALFLFVNAYILRYGIKYLKKCKNGFIRCLILGCIGSIICWHIVALFFDVMDSPPTSIFLWILMGMLLACIKVDEENKLV